MTDTEPVTMIESLERDLEREEEILAVLERQLGAEEEILRRFEDEVVQLQEALPAQVEAARRPGAFVRGVIAAGVAFTLGIAGFGLGVAVERQTTNDVRSQLTTMQARLHNATHTVIVPPGASMRDLVATGFFEGARRRA